MKKKDKISVIIPVYQEDVSLIKKSIDSIKRQTYSNIEILVGVDDPTNILAIKFLKQEAKSNSNFSVYINRENLGLSENLNQLIQLANSKYIARMDADDVANAERLAKQYNFLIVNQLNFVSGSYNSIDENDAIIKLGSNKNLFDKDIRIIEKYGNILTHPLWLVSKDILIKLKYRKVEPVEDYDLISRAILENNVRFGYIGENLLSYRVRNKSESHKSPIKSIILTNKITKTIRKRQVLSVESLNYFKEPSNVCGIWIKITGIYSVIRYKMVRIYIEKIKCGSHL